MPQFRKKPVVINAEKWDGTEASANRIIAWIKNSSGEEGARYIPGDYRLEPGLAITKTAKDQRLRST